MDKEKIKEKEIHKTEFVDKEKASVYYKRTTRKSMTESEGITIEIKDDTSEKAFKTFKKIKKELK